MAKHPAAFINVIAESRNFNEAIEHLQKTWDELQDLREAAKTLVDEIASSGTHQTWKRLSNALSR